VNCVADLFFFSFALGSGKKSIIRNDVMFVIFVIFYYSLDILTTRRFGMYDDLL
jgi:hypothetical protein